MSDLIDRQAAIDALKAQLFLEGTTSDTISKTETVEHLRRVLEATVPNTDYDEGYIDGIEFGISTVSTMPTIQPVATDTNVGDTISRQAAIDALKMDISIIPFAKAREYVRAAIETIHNRLEELQPSQPEPTYEQVEEYCKRRCLHVVTDDFFRVAQPEPKWIPVSERLPETEEFVLTSLTGKYRNTTFEHACEIADYADVEWCVYAYPHMSAEKCAELIEAWMPLPEPYKPNKKQSGEEGA